MGSRAVLAVLFVEKHSKLHEESNAGDDHLSQDAHLVETQGDVPCTYVFPSSLPRQICNVGVHKE